MLGKFIFVERLFTTLVHLKTQAIGSFLELWAEVQHFLPHCPRFLILKGVFWAETPCLIITEVNLRNDGHSYSRGAHVQNFFLYISY